MIVIANGYKLPELDDDGSVWFSALEFDITRLASHSHDGTTGALLTATAQAISSASWAATSGLPGTYDQTVTMPGSLTYDACSLELRLSNGTRIYPTVTKISANSYKVYVNDNTLNLTAVYSS